jgi:urease accessory protein
MFRKIDALLGNLDDFAVGGRAVERVPLASSAMLKRVLRLPSSIGDLGLVFEDERRLRDGDVLVADDARVIAVQVVPDEILVVSPASIAQAVEVAHALGNRHIPIIREGDTIVVGYVSALEDLLRTLGVRYERVNRVLERPFVYAHAPHEHG